MTDEGIAGEILAARDERRQIASFDARVPDWTPARAYGAAARLLDLRRARGERPVGWKIGFTNRNIWPEYGVYAPIWGPVYDTTVRLLDGPLGAMSLATFAEPRIEPEIVLGFERAPHPAASPSEILADAAWIAHGFEIVDSRFANWKFSAADTIADGALHGALIVGPRVPLPTVAMPPEALVQALSSFTIALEQDGRVRDRGTGANVLGSPLAAVAHFLEGVARQPAFASVGAAGIVTTGTLTAALPVAPGETWRTTIEGLPLPGLEVRFE